ncbi:MAG TPA: fibronectin type III domain-containing protein, partial [Nitrosopumilaceae archaeon]|nr:fibronectin type III domain-containing protein [Nitrosopumilaceae archaeon]
MKIKLGICLLFGTMLFLGSFSSSQMVLAEPEFSDKFGSIGSTDGKFKSPSGLALDTGADKLYVVDTDNHRIQIIDVNGDCSGTTKLAEDICFVDEFGGKGTDNGKFNLPTAVVFDTDSNLLYVADSGNDRIQIIDVEGNCSGTTKLADNGNDDVCFVDKFGTSGNGDGEFDLPSGLALDTSTNYLYVADTENNRIQIIDVDGNCKSTDDEYLIDDVCFVDEFGTSGSGSGRFNSPTGLALHTNSHILFVADTDNHKIQIIDVDGNCSGTAKLADADNDICFEDEFGGSGTGDGKLKSPLGLTLDISSDILYIADTDNERIQIIDVDGNCSGTAKLADNGNNDVCFEDKFGKNGSKDGEFEIPSAIILDSGDDLLYVADSGNNRIQLFEISGASGSSSSDAPSKPTGLKAYPVSTTSIFLTWDLADQDENVTGYKIESREGSDNWEEIISNTGSNANSFVHGGLDDGENYSYRVYAINSRGESSVSTTISERPEDSLAPAGFTAIAISPSKIKLSWFPPTSTFKQSITGYIVERQITTGVFEEIGTTGGSTTSFTASGLQTDKTYTYVVKATFSAGGSPRSNSASATPNEDAFEPSSSPSISPPGAPKLSVEVISETEIELSWSKPSDGGSNISKYKIEFKEANDSYEDIKDDIGTSTLYVHKNLKTDVKYTYKVSAINGVGVGVSSNESSAIPTDVATQVLEIKPLGTFSIDEDKKLTFVVATTETLDNVSFSLSTNAPSRAVIGSGSGSFTWTPSNAQIGTYTFDIIARSGSLQDTESVTITVNEKTDSNPEPPSEEPKDEPKEPTELGMAAFVDPNKDPQSYVDRYNNEPSYKEWFDENYSEYDSIYQAVGLKEKLEIAAFVDPTQDPQYYVDRYNNEPSYKEWFDENFPEYNSIHEAVGLDEETEPDIVEPKVGNCGEGTELVNGVCTAVDQPKGGGCLIATAAYGSEMAPQVQFLREIRDNKVMSTESGVSFMTGFNQFYYSF